MKCRIWFFAGLSFLILFLFSCDSKRYFEENKEYSRGIWSSTNNAIFFVKIEDIKNSYNFYINVRNSGEYPYSNLYLFLKSTAPDGHTSRDTLECQLADYSGKWLGSGMTGIKFNRFLFQKGVHFNQKGIYTFELEQAMRVKDLKGIHDIGIRLEKN